MRLARRPPERAAKARLATAKKNKCSRDVGDTARKIDMPYDDFWAERAEFQIGAGLSL